MAEVTPQLKYVYKILPASAAPPNPLPDQLPVSELDQLSGFMHLSTAKQIPGTLKLFFSDQSEVYLLKIAISKINVDNALQWENSNGDQGNPGEDTFFPHLYNDFKLGRAQIDSFVCCRRGGASWDDALAKLPSQSDGSWLE